MWNIIALYISKLYYKTYSINDDILVLQDIIYHFLLESV